METRLAARALERADTRGQNHQGRHEVIVITGQLLALANSAAGETIAIRPEFDRGIVAVIEKARMVAVQQIAAQAGIKIGIALDEALIDRAGLFKLGRRDQLAGATVGDRVSCGTSTSSA